MELGYGLRLLETETEQQHSTTEQERLDPSPADLHSYLWSTVLSVDGETITQTKEWPRLPNLLGPELG